MFETAMFYDLMEKLQKKVHQNSRDKGFWDGPENENIPTKIALTHSELSEMLEAFRNGNPPCEKTITGHGGEYEGKQIPIGVLLWKKKQQTCLFDYSIYVSTYTY